MSRTGSLHANEPSDDGYRDARYSLDCSHASHGGGTGATSREEKNADERLETTVKATISKAYDKGLSRGTTFMV